MPTGKEWDDHFESLDGLDLIKLNTAVNTIMELDKDWMGKHLWINAIAPVLRGALAKVGGHCDHCWGQYLQKEWTPEDLCEVEEYGTKRHYCPDCYEDKVAMGQIDPQGE